MEKLKICDNHIHIGEQKHIENTVDIFKKIIDENDYERMTIQAIPSYYGRSENYEVFYCKDMLAPRVYANVGMCHNLNENDTADYYFNEIKAYYDMGCDGVKILDGKPDSYRAVGRRLNDKIYDKFYAFCEEMQIPVTMHLGDPASFWDWENATDIQKKKGWVYSEKDASLEQLRSEAFDILEKFPKLTMIFAHFCFMSGELERASENFEKYENLYLDLTPGVEMYKGFTDNYNDAKRFFEKYSTRILYGTDASSNYDADSWTHAALNIVRPFLEGTDEYIDANISKEPLKPFGFSGDILAKIYRDNFVKIYGEAPRPLDAELIAESIPEFENRFSLNVIERENLKHIQHYFESEK